MWMASWRRKCLSCSCRRRDNSSTPTPRSPSLVSCFNAAMLLEAADVSAEYRATCRGQSGANWRELASVEGESGCLVRLSQVVDCSATAGRGWRKSVGFRPRVIILLDVCWCAVFSGIDGVGHRLCVCVCVCVLAWEKCSELTGCLLVINKRMAVNGSCGVTHRRRQPPWVSTVVAPEQAILFHF